MSEAGLVPRADFHAALASPARRRLLELLRAADGPRDVHELAGEMAMHVTTVRFHLEVLRRGGLVVRLEGSGGQVGRPRVSYAPVSQCPGSGPDRYRELAGVLAAHLAGDGGGGASGAERAGAAWAHRLVTAPRQPGRTVPEAAVEVAGLFAEMGFEPELTRAGPRQRIALHACPFRALARDYPDVVCSVHRGLLRETVSRLGVPADSVLTAFVAPDLCVAELREPNTAAPAKRSRARRR